MDINEIQVTPIWALFEKGRNYHRRVGIYEDTDKNERFYHGDQWAGAKLGGVEPVTKNFIKPIVNYKLSVIHDNLYAIVYSSQNYENQIFRKEAERFCKMLNGYASKVWEKDKMDKKSRKITKDAAVTGEGILYVYFDKENMIPANEVINKADVYYGNENDDDIQSQPYILIRKRLAHSVAIEYAKSLGMSEDKVEFIIGDTDTFEESGEAAKEELDNNVTIVYKLYKKDKTVHFSAATRWVTIVEDEDLGISLYPIAHFNWGLRKGSARGDGEVKHLIPNQIEVNKTEMRRVVAIKNQAYPLKVIDVTKVENPHDISTVGGVIKAKGQTVDDVHKIVGIIPPAQMSPDVAKHQEELINMSRELAGAGDNATGSVNPESASGKAILAVQQAQRAPITEHTDGFKDTIEDLARIWLEMLTVHATNGVTLEEKETDPRTGKEAIRLVKVPQSALKQLKATVKIDVTPKSAFDRFAQELSLENLLNGGYFGQRMPELKIYVKLLPDDSVMPKAKLEQAVEEYEKEQRKIAMIQQRAQMMQQKAQMFLMQDLDGQAQQIADAQSMLEAQAAMQGQIPEEAPIEGEEEVEAEEKAMDKKEASKEKQKGKKK